MSAIPAATVSMRTLADGTLRLTCDIEPRHAQDAFALFGSPGTAAALAALVPEHARSRAPEKAPEKAPHTLAQRMHIDGYFRNVKLWLAMHEHGLWTLQQHKAWAQAQPCCGSAFLPGHRCEGDVVAHHADQSSDMVGGKRQPENPQKGLHYYCAPVCHAYHTHIHTKATREEKQDLRVYAIQLTADRMKDAMKAHLGIASLSYLTEEMKVNFERDIGL